MSQSKTNLKTLVTMAVLTALAIAADIFLRLPNIGGFLTYEPKDVILTISAFIFGPVQGILMSLIVCLVEMVTISTTGLIGLLMNFLASASFIGISSLIYYKKKTLSHAIIGLVSGSLTMIVIMLLWNYIITPVFMNVPRDTVVKMILPLLLPFNAIKAALNSALILFLYKPVVTALRMSKLISSRPSNDNAENKKVNTALIVILSLILTVTFTFILLIFAGIL